MVGEGILILISNLHSKFLMRLGWGVGGVKDDGRGRGNDEETDLTSSSPHQRLIPHPNLNLNKLNLSHDNFLLN